MHYPLSLAIEDFIPVILGGLGFYLVARLWANGSESSRRLGVMGAALVFAGGLSKATWKLLHSLSHGSLDIALLNKALFFCLGPGFIFLAFALLSAGRSEPRSGWSSGPWKSALVTVFLALSVSLSLYFTSPGRGYEFVMLGATVLASNVVLVIAIRRAWRAGQPLSAALYAGYLATTYVLPVMMAGEQSVAMQWAEQALNTAATLGLCVAGSLLIRRRRTAPA